MLFNALSLTDIQTFSLHVSKWAQYYVLNLTHVKWHISGGAWSNISGGYEGSISHEIKS